MDDTYKTKEQLLGELEVMRLKLGQLNDCRLEVQGAQERYEKLLNAAPDAMIFVDSEAEIVMVNAQMEQLFGYSQEEVIGRRLDILIPERLRDRHRVVVSGYLSSPKVRSMGSDFKIYALRKDGTEFRADISLSPLRTDTGLLVVAAVRDVTERIEAQERIERNYHIQRVISAILKISLEPVSLEEQLSRALDLVVSVPHLSLQSKGAIYLVEEEPGKLVLKVERGMTDRQRETCSTIAFGTCLCGRAASTCDIVFTECVDERHDVQYDGMFPHGHYCVPIMSGVNTLGLINVFVSEGHRRNPEEEQFLTAMADTLAGIIERHHVASEKRRLQEQLVQHEKLAALGRISANVAHEIRNPLTSVGGFARRLLRKMPEGTKEREYADFIVSEVSYLENVLRDVLTYSRVSAPRFQEQNIHDIVDAVIALHGEALQRRSITVQKSYGDLPHVDIDRDQVQEVIGNLVSNAVDSMPTGGTLTITTRREMVDDKPSIVVTIGDTGEGITEAILDRVFEPFYSTKVGQRGIGLGLPIAKKIMEDHGGSVSVKSKVGQGSSFFLYFPLNPRQRNSS